MNITLLESEEIYSFPTPDKTNFYYSFSFLPKIEREAINTVYAFCRKIDDIVDENSSFENEVVAKKRRRLEWWRNELERCYEGNSAILLPLHTVIHRFSIPKQHFLTVIDGCEQDLLKYRYETFSELKEYCYAVASAVGLICIEIFGYKYEETKEYAINLGYALQLTNILRDIKADKERGYIYLPLEDLEKFRYSEEKLIAENYNAEFIELMRYQTRRIREHFHKARMALRPDERVTMFTAEIMDAIYYRLLEKIELNDYNVFEKKIRVSASHKFMIALKHWLTMRMFISRLKK